MSTPFETPTTMMLAGPTQSGKSFWVNKLIIHKESMFKTCPIRIVYCYGAWQKMFLTMKDVRFHKGLPTEDDLDKWSGEHMLLILDDVMQEACSPKNIFRVKSRRKKFLQLVHSANLQMCIHLIQLVYVSTSL